MHMNLTGSNSTGEPYLDCRHPISHRAHAEANATDFQQQVVSELSDKTPESDHNIRLLIGRLT